MAIHIGRREFIFTLGGAAAAWPLAARAQQPTMPVVGFLHPASPEGYADRLRAFHRGLKETGYAEGENVAIEYRWADNQIDRLPALAAELVRRKVAVIVGSGSGPAQAAKAATVTIPIVFVVPDDPVRLGLVASLARPGENLTGINVLAAELTTKRLEFLRELVPGTARVALLVNPANAVNTEATVRDVETAARAMSLQVQMILKASTSREIDLIFAMLAREPVDALFIGADALFNSRRRQIAILAARYVLPATYSQREFPEAGGLMSYGPNYADAWRQVGNYVGRILNGAKPLDLPVVQASKFELVINAQTARTLGLTVPPSLLAIADEVIE
jgi:putative ABC transport system substrate-binding protein